MPLTTLSATSASDEILSQLQQDGAVIIENVIDRAKIAALVAEVMPYIDATPYGQDDFFGRRTRRTGALAARSPTCRELITDDLILKLANDFLGAFTRKIILHLTQTIQISPGAGAQAIHRDRYAWGAYLPRDIEPQFNTIWALTDFTKENGATACVPGSQTWDWQQKPTEEQMCYAEMSAGSVFIYSGSVLHCGGENQSKESRLGLNLTYCLGWLRQEENQYLSCPPDVAKDFDPVLQDLLGYTQGEYALGYYSDPYGSGEESEVMPPEWALGRKIAKPGLG